MKKPKQILFVEFLKRKWRIHAFSFLCWLALLYFKLNPQVRPEGRVDHDLYFDTLVYGFGVAIIVGFWYDYATRDARK
ncbi:MAG: hypothetical protein ABJP66_06680 [Hyphomicrobiales bacterium]